MYYNDVLQDFFNNNEVNSFKDLEDNWDKGRNLKKEFEQSEILNEVKKLLEVFLSYLFNEDIPFYHKQALLTYQCQLLQPFFRGTFRYPSLMLALYVGDSDIYRNIPLLWKKLIDKLNITPYTDKSLEDIKVLLDKYFNISESHINGIDYYEIDNNICLNSLKYEKYDESNSNSLSGTDYFFIWGEERSYILEARKHPDEVVYWIAKDIGDGFGFDVLRYDSVKQKERLMEIKTGTSWRFYLTQNEYNVMLESAKRGGEYFIYKYTYHLDTNKIDGTRYQYIPDKDVLIDLDGNCYSLVEEKNEYEEGNPIHYGLKYEETLEPKTLTKKNG